MLPPVCLEHKFNKLTNSYILDLLDITYASFFVYIQFFKPLCVDFYRIFQINLMTLFFVKNVTIPGKTDRACVLLLSRSFLLFACKHKLVLNSNSYILRVKIRTVTNSDILKINYFYDNIKS